jgi:acid phosphatase family membrane protein YuiD
MTDIVTSPYIIALFVAWLGAHIIKYVISHIKDEKRDFGASLFRSGGMPSSHSTTVASIVTLIGLRDGFDSGLFGLAALFALIVMYDAAKVRRSSGEQGIAIQQMIREQKSKIKLPRAAQGHTPLEVSIGALLGVLIGVVVFLSTN